MHSILSTNIYGASTINIQGTTSGAEDTGIIGTGQKVQCQLNRKDSGEEERGKGGRQTGWMLRWLAPCTSVSWR